MHKPIFDRHDLPRLTSEAFALCLMLPLSMSISLPTWAAETNTSVSAQIARSGITPTTIKPAKTEGPVRVASGLHLTTGKSQLLQLPENAARISVGNPEVADVMLINPREIYLLGKKTGQTNLLVWTASGSTTLRDLTVGADVRTLETQLLTYVPSAENLRVDSVADTLVVSGRVGDAMKVQRLMALTEAFHGNKKVINLLKVNGVQQVMLEVKIAEVSKTLLDELGVDMNLTRTVGSTSVNLLSQLLTNGATTVTAARANGLSTVTLTAEMKKGLIKVLAEPTITAVNGQEGSFLAGGKIFIPVPQSSSAGVTTITLQEKEFGVGLKFLPTVLEDGLINLHVTPEVSELSQVGTTVKGMGGQSSLLPTITSRRASTTVQLRDGESFAIGGLIKSNVTESIKAMPLLGEIPVLGALFRSTAFQTEKSELLFVVTPRLAKALPANYALPTDAYIQPTRTEFFLVGRLEGLPANAPKPSTPTNTAKSQGNESAPGLPSPPPATHVSHDQVDALSRTN